MHAQVSCALLVDLCHTEARLMFTWPEQRLSAGSLGTQSNMPEQGGDSES